MQFHNAGNFVAKKMCKDRFDNLDAALTTDNWSFNIILSVHSSLTSDFDFETFKLSLTFKFKLSTKSSNTFWHV